MLWFLLKGKCTEGLLYHVGAHLKALGVLVLILGPESTTARVLLCQSWLQMCLQNRLPRTFNVIFYSFSLLHLSFCFICHTVSTVKHTVLYVKLPHLSQCHSVISVTMFYLSHCSICHTVASVNWCHLYVGVWSTQLFLQHYCFIDNMLWFLKSA